MRSLAILFSFVLLNSTAKAQDFSSFQKILEKHLTENNRSDGGYETSFNYDQAKVDKGTIELISKQASELAQFDIKKLKTKEEATAFWINSYNFFMIKIILEKGFEKSKRKINSVKDLGSFFSPYRIFTKDINEIGGKKYSLDKMEKGILLGEEYKKKGWKDARIHFAVNCASVGCPPLVPIVYDPKTVNEVLNQNITKAFKTKRHFHLDGKKLNLTHLFKWYKKDFSEDAGSVKGFLKKHTKNPKIKEQIDKVQDIDHIDYDWNLNRPANFK